MSNIFVKECKDCNEIRNLVASLDRKIKELSRVNLYNKKYLTGNKSSYRELQDLIYYKNIATNLQWDSSYYYPDFTRKDVISEIKAKLKGTRVEVPFIKRPVYANPTPPPSFTGTFITDEDGNIIITEDGQQIITE